MNKYHNIKVEVDGLKFDSKKEAAYYGILKMRKLAGEITSFERQVVFEIDVMGQPICKYVADFIVYYPMPFPYEKRDIIDVKGIKTPVYKLKKKLMKACYGIDIVDV